MRRLAGRLSYHALRLLPPEAAHEVGKAAMKRGLLAGGEPVRRPVTLFGTELPNPIGMAAGFDKNGELLHNLHRYGFGFAEVGSVTRRGGPGNPKPRMFRLDYPDVMNRMGLNGDPAEIVAARLRNSPTPLFGVNVAKTHDPQIVGDAAIEDVAATYELVRDLGFYTVLNVSCPNTREGKTFEEPAALAELLAAVQPLRRAVPMCVKLSPRDEAADYAQVLQVCEAAGVDGYVAVNTRPVNNAHGKGGQSGTTLATVARQAATFITRETDKPVLGCGGVFTPTDARALLAAGATVVQAYNGLVRGPHAGPTFASELAAGVLKGSGVAETPTAA